MESKAFTKNINIFTISMKKTLLLNCCTAVVIAVTIENGIWNADEEAEGKHSHIPTVK